MKQEMRKYCAEFTGTAVLVFVAVGAAIFSGQIIVGALAFGLVLIALVYTLGGISGGHFNPAVSLAMFMNKKISVHNMGLYMVAQVLGAILGGLLLFALVNLADIRDPGTIGVLDNLFNGSNQYDGLNSDTGSAVFAAMLIEIILTFVFVFTILMVTAKSENAKIAGIVIGLTLALVHLVGIPLTGTSVNPARSIGTALFGGADALRQVWVFIFAPLGGAVLAALAARAFLSEGKPTDEKKEKEAEATAE